VISVNTENDVLEGAGAGERRYIAGIWPERPVTSRCAGTSVSSGVEPPVGHRHASLASVYRRQAARLARHVEFVRWIGAGGLVAGAEGHWYHPASRAPK
jgi:hypothetical protein